MEPISALGATTVASKAGESLAAATSVETVKAAEVKESIASVGEGSELAGNFQSLPQNGVSGFDFKNPEFEFSASQLGVGVERTVEGLRASDLQLIGEMRDLYAESWNTLSVEGRRDALQALENTLAQMQGRELCEVVIDDMPSVVNCGYFNPLDRTIHVNRIHLSDVDYRMEAIDTIAHEGRHAYQRWAVETPYFHPDMKEVAYWSENIDNYINAEKFGFEYYESQPIEVDARYYASIVKTALEVGESINENGVARIASSEGDNSVGMRIAPTDWAECAKEVQAKTIKEAATDAAVRIREFILDNTSPSDRRAALVALAHAASRIRI